ncbi:activating signal cointegrator 1 complex subunit 2 isoform X2 [Balaenoptera acutorostrata]|uniref:Activating signal cointegrator 1 complex subunit 2 isoform X2 n=1 Tax=Balaenoptera acutorostrata TaxID=9767 RepID=A0ABM3RXU7_BALAC|nr:activating signal cointegrator 1 complex subunit 2 isoform X2 [Balaenoptera acutorostrata]XP_057382425.1 activating signal cointegrator 1 complex subunit 2 isoform X2 [Balaenoptera acutorostrata]
MQHNASSAPGPTPDHPQGPEDREAEDFTSAVEEYLERATFVANDLDWLLALPHDKFWCQVVFDETLQKCLDSYLHYVPRKFDEWVAPAPEVVDMEKRLHRSVFLTFLRMSTHKESKDHFISPSAFGEILYNNFLFDIPKILDLCVLFGKGNSPLLQKMIGNIFLQQPSYYNDLDETMPTILQVFSNILQHCGLQGDGACATPQKLEERGRLTPSDMPLLELKDIVLYLCDTCTTLWAFLDIFPLACPTFQKHDFCYRLASFYEIAIPELESAIKKRRLEDSKLLGDLWQRLSHSRKKLLEIFHILLNQICLLPVLESSCDNIQGFIEEFLQIFSSLLQEKRFLRDYDALFPVADDISLLQQASSALDETRTAYILQAVESAWEGVDRRKATNAKDPPVAENPNRVVEAAEAVSRPSSLPQNLEEEECLGAAAAPGPVCGVELDSLISQVKDLLPDLGEGFILACLEHYSYDPEQVINNILEGRLAPALSQLDHGLDRQVKPDPTPLLASRHNIFQNDEFDVFSRDSVDLSRVHKGRRKEESARSLLNDKREVVAQRRRYEQYSVVAEEVPVQPGEDSPYRGDDYEDEYDDTYDGNQVGANDADSDDELISRRPFTIPQVLRTKVPREGQEEDEEEEEEEAEDEAPKPDHFVQDPAVLREKAEARRMAFLARKGYRHDSSTAVAGNPRGHGQSRETTQERRKKESSKATRANHNRRTMTDRKRSKGMIPS